MIQITNNISIDEKEIGEEFIRSSGPGGQNVNKVSTAVQLRFDVKNSTSLPADIKKRLLSLAGKKITAKGILLISARSHRTQEKNRRDALDRLISMIRKACEKPKKRQKTNPSSTSIEQRLRNKHKKSESKRQRLSVITGDE